MRSVDARIYRAVGYLAANRSAARIFRAITNQIGVTGWQLARASIERPAEIERILTELLKVKAVRADGHGLDAYYQPSAEGYILREIV